MKSILLLVTLVTFPVAVFAASGACSGHGGVSCSVGADSDGSVICVDGWRNSSVSYASMVKCGGYSAPSVETRPAPQPIFEPKPIAPAPVIEPEPITPVPVVTPPAIVDTPSPRVTASPINSEATKTPERRASSTPIKIEPKSEPLLQVVDVPASVPKAKEKGFWSRVFSFFFRKT